MSDEQETARRHIKAQMAGLTGLLNAGGVMEVVVNGPGSVWVETRDGWQRRTVDGLTADRIEHLARAVATFSSQTVGKAKPLLSATLPDGERIQVALPPAVGIGHPSLTIRKPAGELLLLGDLEEKGLFSGSAGVGAVMRDSVLDEAFKGPVAVFLRQAVLAKQNIIISGATGSGKTTLSKALVHEIPRHERIITIEDTPELDVPHENSVRMYYSKGGQGAAAVGARELLESCLRMRPDRILLQELRDGTAFYYLRNVNSGHPGSITTVHADTCVLALEQLSLLVKESETGRDLGREDVMQLLRLLINVVVQCKRVNGKFRVTEMMFRGVVRSV